VIVVVKTWVGVQFLQVMYVNITGITKEDAELETKIEKMFGLMGEIMMIASTAMSQRRGSNYENWIY